jgi:DNA polymerase beta
LKQIVDLYNDKGLLIDSLTTNVTTKYMGVCKNTSKSIPRRIDIRFIPMESIYFAMLYFTGSGTFNKNMRTFAIKKGFKLNEYGLYKNNLKVKINSENDIFDLLDLDYVNPEDRVNNYVFGFTD